ncbi:MAG: molybdopterin molybdotransferase MoeA [Treponema sp.]|jgi:molybdopterin molybdotransferase|nr:molybdopterin molybdotransferase MoeA [Treponema sp.]
MLKADWLSLEKAVEILLERTKPVEETVELPLYESLGRIAAEEIRAPLDNPPFDRSSMDGFALRSQDTASEKNLVPLKIRGESGAGKPFQGRIGAGEAIRIMTGAMIPPGADAVIPKEAVREEGGVILVPGPLEEGNCIGFRGEDIRKGGILAPEGTRLDAVMIGILSSMGIEKIGVYRQPKIGILCTGDELLPPGGELEPGKIYDANTALLSCRLREWGFDPYLLPRIGDNASAASSLIASHIGNLDILISSGAVSVGEYDIIHEVYGILEAESLFWRLANRPGSAIRCGIYRGKLMMNLSGNPFACIVSLELAAKPVLAKISRRKDLKNRRVQGTLANSFTPDKTDLRRFIRCRYENGMFTVPAGRSSARLFSFLNCNCLLDLPAGTGFLSEGAALEGICFTEGL